MSDKGYSLNIEQHILIMLDMIPMIKKTDIVNAIEKDETKEQF